MISILPNNQILIGGNFTTLAPHEQTTQIDDFYMAELNPDGTVYTAFNPDPNTDVFVITQQSTARS